MIGKILGRKKEDAAKDAAGVRYGIHTLDIETKYNHHVYDE